MLTLSINAVLMSRVDHCNILQHTKNIIIMGYKTAFLPIISDTLPYKGLRAAAARRYALRIESIGVAISSLY